ncbi:MAG: alpha/beta fold hydrolase [Rhodobacteraceae bacterium]|nr:alpha/beta fold hydrolase [Paracoccaceae bacterium]
MTRRRFFSALLTLAILYCAYGAVMTYLHPRYIYPFAPTVFAMDGFERHMIDVPQAAPLAVWVHTAALPGQPVIVYFMGNAGTLDIHKAPLRLHSDAGRNVIAMEYRGGGGAPGAPSEARLKADALAVLDAAPALAGPGPVFVHGYSMGTGLALHVASARPVNGVILDAPFARICDLMRRAAALPACWMPFVQKWDSLAYAGAIVAPVLIQHGDSDTKIPPAEGLKLAEALRAGGTEVVFNELIGGTHGRLIEVPGYVEALDAFIGTNR